MITMIIKTIIFYPLVATAKLISFAQNVRRVITNELHNVLGKTKIQLG